jgi:tellurite resistance protein
MTTDTPRIPLNTFAIGFGLAGLAEVWDAAGTSLGFPSAVAQAFWIIATVAWVWLLVAHIVRGARSQDRLSAQLRHPGQGPIAALLPITGMLIAGDLLTLAKPVGVTLFLVATVVAAVFAAWLIGTWLQGGLALESVHGGYLLPTVAAGFVGADVAARSGLVTLGWALFGVGAFFWVVMTLLVMVRLAFRPSLPDPLVPTMAILVAPPAVGGLAWFALNGLRADPVADMIAGLGVILVLVQVALIPKYRRIGFSLGFWSFTFPTAAVVTDAILWLRLSGNAASQITTAVLLTVLTAMIVTIAIRSLILVAPSIRRHRAEATLVAADNADARQSVR